MGFIDESGLARIPDFYTLSGTVPVSPVTPWLGVGATISVDGYGDWYVGPIIPAIGLPSALQGSLVAGWKDRWAVPSQSELEKLLSQWSLHGGGGYIVGGEESWTPGAGFATGVGIFSPGGGAQASYSWELHQRKNCPPKGGAK